MTTGFATIIGALVAAAASIIVCVLNNNKQNAKQSALIAYRLAQLEEKVGKHNNLVERTYKLEEHTALQEEKIKVANKRIDDLERIAGGKSA